MKTKERTDMILLYNKRCYCPVCEKESQPIADKKEITTYAYGKTQRDIWYIAVCRFCGYEFEGEDIVD